MRKLSCLLALALFAGALPVSAEQRAAPARIATADLAAPPIAQAMRLSPDGTRIAAVGSDKDNNYVFIVSPDDPTKVLRRFTIGKMAIDDVYWANNDRLILPLFSDAYLFGFRIRVARFRVVEISSGEIRNFQDQIKNFAVDEVLRVDPGGRTAIVSGFEGSKQSPSVKRLDLVTGSLTPVQDSIRGVDNWFVDESGVVRGGLSRDGYRWEIHYRVRDGEPLHKIKGKFDSKDEDIFDAVYFSPLPGETVVISNHATGRFAAYRLDLETVEPGTLIFENPNGDIDSMLVDPATRKMVGFRYHDERWKTHFIDRELAQIQARVDRAVPGADNQLVDWSADRKKILIRSAKSDDPGVFYLLDRAGGEMKIITAQYPSVPVEFLSATRLVRYQARDGLTVPAFLTLPKGRDERGLPLIVMPHGGPFSRDTGEYDPWVQLMANRGYAVLQPQFRGSTGFGRDFVARGYGEWGRKMQDDVDDGVQWLARMGAVDANRVCIAGGSYGGYAAMWGAIRHPQQYRCAISWAGVTDLKMMLRHDKSLFAAPRYYRHWRDRVLGDEKAGDLDSVSPLKQVRQLRVPLLLGHGRLDENVPIEQAEALAKAAAKAGIAIDKIYYDKAGHGLFEAEVLGDWLGRVERFLSKHNPANPAQAAASGASAVSQSVN